MIISASRRTDIPAFGGEDRDISAAGAEDRCGKNDLAL